MNQVSHPAYESWSNFKEELEVKFPPSWVQLVSHEEVINNISCQKKRFLNCWYHSILKNIHDRIIVKKIIVHVYVNGIKGEELLKGGEETEVQYVYIYCTHYSAQNFPWLVFIIILVSNDIC